jgi:hypothetical protein
MTATYTFDVFSSLDGYGAASAYWTGYWGKQGPELLDHRLDLYGAEQRMVFGANTYRAFARMLASSTEESEVRGPWVTRMRSLPATVVSTTLEGPLNWPNATVVSGDAVVVVRRLKEESGAARDDPKLAGERLRELIAHSASTAARRSSMTTCARSGRCSFRGRERFSGRSIGRARSASSISGSQRARCRSGTASHGARGDRRVPGILARRRRRADLLQEDAGPAGGDLALSVVARRAAADAGLGSPSRVARRRRAPDRGVRRVLRPAEGRLALLQAARPASQARRRATGGLHRAQLRARRGVRERARLPAANSTGASLSARTSAITPPCVVDRSTGCSRNKR